MASARSVSQGEKEAQGRAQGERIQAYCKFIWGECDYELDIYTEWDPHQSSYVLIRKDLGDGFGPPLIMTRVCSSEDQAWTECERMLNVWARQVLSGQPMTREQRLEIFSEPNGQGRRVLEQFHEWLEKRDGKA